MRNINREKTAVWLTFPLLLHANRRSATKRRTGTFRIVTCFKLCQRCETPVGLMAPKRTSETAKDVLLWGVGVVAPLVLLLLLLRWA